MDGIIPAHFCAFVRANPMVNLRQTTTSWFYNSGRTDSSAKALVQFRRGICAVLFVCLAVNGSPAGIGERRAVVEAAQKYVGVREKGNNDGLPYVLFMRPYGLGRGTYWCGLFVATVFRDAKVQHGVKGVALAANWQIPANTIVYKWGRPVNGKIPFAGDLALFRFGGSRIDHIEIVINWPEDENYFWVIGGNTSNPNKPGEQGVFAKKRLKRDALIVNRIDFYNASV